MLRVITLLTDDHGLRPEILAGLICFCVGLAAMHLFHRARAVARLEENNRLLRGTLDNLDQGVTLFDAQARLVLCNERYIEMYGLSRAVVKPGATIHDIVQHRIDRGVLFLSDPEKYVADIIRSMSARKPFVATSELQDGRIISVVNRPTPDGGCVVTDLDVTERRKAEKELEETRTFLNQVIENVPSPVIVKDARDFKYVLINRAGEEYFGVTRDRMIGRTAADLFSPETAEAMTAQEKQLLADRVPRHSEEEPAETVGRGMRIVSATRLPVMGADGEPRYLVAVLQDVTERKRAEARIARLAHYDTLTDLPNRAAFNECFAATLERAAHENGQFAVLSLDLDRFKDINDVFGHAAGDALLRWVTARLSAAAEGAFLARTGGDEFALIVFEHAAAEAAARVAARLLAAVADDFEFDGNRLHVGLSVGVALYPVDGTLAATLVANADAALYRAKADGTGTIRFFEADMDASLRERRVLVQDLREALGRNELLLHYQPQATIDGTITGFEALVRWRHPERGLLAPNLFIPGAEESGLILELGEWILREACRVAASWATPLNIAVNLSPVQFRHGDLVGLVHSALLETGLSPQPARARDHRKRADRRFFARAVDPAPPQDARRAHRHGRLRHRLFVIVQPAGFSVRQDQDRPVLHRQPGKQRTVRHHRARRPRSRSRLVAAGQRRGHRDRGAAHVPVLGGLHRGAGLPGRQAAADRGLCGAHRRPRGCRQHHRGSRRPRQRHRRRVNAN